MRASLDQATDPWGIKVNRVELKNILPPAQIVDAMEKQMKAERERREAILIAEGEKKSAILRAEGKKEAAILDAEAEKTAAILRAEAEKEKMIKEAEGHAEAILKVQEANAQGIRLIKEAGADQAVLTLKSFEALSKVADGQATKIIIPSELQNVAGAGKSRAGGGRRVGSCREKRRINGQMEEKDMNLKGRNFLTLKDFTPEEITYLLDLAAELKAEKKSGKINRRHEGKNIALIFEKTSTRTRCSFEVAAYDMGMHVTYLDPSGSQIGKKESIRDTARVLGRMYDGIEYRGFEQGIVGGTGPVRRRSGVERP